MKTLFKGALTVLAVSATLGESASDADALDAVREEARAALAGGFRDLNAGRMSLTDLAGRAADMAAAATNSPALRRVLQEGAFNMFREAGALGRAAERRVPFWINLGTEAEFEFAACPAGSFTMGCDGDPKSESFRHRVNITRPFWMARLQTTKRLYATFRRMKGLSEEERCHGGLDIPAGGLSRADMFAFCEFLTGSNRGRIPEGYVFRLPTDAEWEYALNANCDEPGDPYVRFREGDASAAGEISVLADAVNRRRAECSLPAVTSGQGAVFRCGTRRPNAWGIFDMLGNGGEALLDTIEADVECRYGEGVFASGAASFDFAYAEEETDPLRYSASAKRLGMMRGTARWKRFGPQWYGRTVISCGSHWNGHYTFRVVLAPDILRERGLEGGR